MVVTEVEIVVVNVDEAVLVKELVALLVIEVDADEL